MEENEMYEKQLGNQEREGDMRFLSAGRDGQKESMFSKHLEPLKLLKFLEKLLMGYEQDDNGKWIAVMTKVKDNNGKLVEIERGALLNPDTVRMSIGYLKVFLNSNTYLSYIDDKEMINNTMWSVSLALTRLLHPLKKTHDQGFLSMLYSMLENSIYFAILRGYKKISLDAMTKQQHSIEHLQQGAQGQQQPKDKKMFKMFGF